MSISWSSLGEYQEDSGRRIESRLLCTKSRNGMRDSKRSEQVHCCRAMPSVFRQARSSLPPA